MRLRKPAFGKRFLTIGLALGVPFLVAAAVAIPDVASAASVHTVKPHSTTVTYWLTQYGWTDNSPPGPAIAYTGCKTPGGQKVTADNYSGTNGTYDDPLVYADPQHLNGPWCQIIYVPFMKKYYIHADQCDPCGGKNKDHFDLWMGGDKNSTKNPENKALLACENKWTQTNTVILSATSGESVTSGLPFKPPTDCVGP